MEGCFTARQITPKRDIEKELRDIENVMVELYGQALEMRLQHAVNGCRECQKALINDGWTISELKKLRAKIKRTKKTREG